MPIPIQSGSISDRLRKFFRIRGKTGFTLDEVVAPVVIVQDLTKGPYQSGVTPAGGSVRHTIVALDPGFSIVIVLNDKLGSLTPVLDRQFDERSFSFTFAEVQNTDIDVAQLSRLQLKVGDRANIVAAGVPVAASGLFSIQTNNGSIRVPVEMFTYPAQITGGKIWDGLLGDNTNTLGSRRLFDSIQPNVTIGPDDALIFTTDANTQTTANSPAQIIMSVRGFYQEQPA